VCGGGVWGGGGRSRSDEGSDSEPSGDNLGEEELV